VKGTRRGEAIRVVLAELLEGHQDFVEFVDRSSIPFFGCASNAAALQESPCSKADKGSSLVLMHYMKECMDLGADNVYFCFDRLQELCTAVRAVAAND
jgi:hypothetical protein